MGNGKEPSREHGKIKKPVRSFPVRTENEAAAQINGDTLALHIVPYAKLNARQQELKNFHQAAAILAEYGFNSIKLSDDWNGADFLAIHLDGVQNLPIQLKARLAIDNKYTAKNPLMIFPIKGIWYLIRHNELVEKVRSATGWLLTKAWLDTKNYHSAAPGKALLASLKSHRLGTIRIETASDDE